MHRLRGLLNIATMAALACGLAACSQVQPYQTSVIDPDPSPQSQTETAKQAREATMAALSDDPSKGPVSVCYSRLASTPQQVVDIVKLTCGAKTPYLVEQKLDLTSCTLLTPMRATFRCQPAQ